MCLGQAGIGHIYMLIKCIAAKRIHSMPSKLGHSKRQIKNMNHALGKLHLLVSYLKGAGICRRAAQTYRRMTSKYRESGRKHCGSRVTLT